MTSPSPTSDTLTLAIELLAKRSITPEDDGCLALIEARLAPLGFSCERLDHHGVSNLWARRGKRTPLVCFAGHTDVVPTGPLDKWTSNPFKPQIRDGHLFARGAADMKTSVAAFVVAIERYLQQHPDTPGSIALLLTSDEEGPAQYGTTHVIETLRARGESIDYCIVGEPTSSQTFGDTLKNGRRGSLSGTLTVQGKQGHIAYPHLARNPIHAAAPALAELSAMHWDDGNAYFPPTSFQISNIHSGQSATNVIPGECTVLFNFRFASCSSAEMLKSKTEAVLQRHQLTYQLDWHLSGNPFLTGEGTLVTAMQQAVKQTVGITPALSTTGGTSDGRFIATHCAEVVEFGPINASIHQVNECIKVADIEPLTHIYQHTLDLLLNHSD